MYECQCQQLTNDQEFMQREKCDQRVLLHCQGEVVPVHMDVFIPGDGVDRVLERRRQPC